MNDNLDPAPAALALAAVPCWSTIGVVGDLSCPELVQHIHCRNCPVYSSAARARLDSDASAEAVAERTRHFATPKMFAERDTQSVVIFRIAAEWLALPTTVVVEVAELRSIHSVPHRSSGAVLGVANIRGELLVCVSLGRLLGIEPPIQSSGAPARAAGQRLLVIRRGEVRAVAPADEVCGIHHFHPHELKPLPATVAKAPTVHSKAVVSWSGHTVGVLDEQILFRTLQRSVA